VKQKTNGFDKLFLSKIGHIKMRLHRRIQGNIKTCQIIRTKTDKWYVCLSCDEVPLEPLSKTNKCVGIDLGVKTYITISDGETIGNPKYLNKTRHKLEAAQRKLSKLGYKNSKRHAAKQHVARLHEKIKNQREDFQHKVSSKLVLKYDQIFMEDLEIKTMKSWRNLNRAISDCAWGNFVNKVSYKAERAGKKLIKVDPRNTSVNAA
jgi:putative transposase